MHQHHHGGGDHVHAALARDLQQLAVDLRQGVVDGIQEIAQVGRAHQRPQPLHQQLAGVVAGTVATQAIGHHPQPGVFAQQQGIFVETAHLAGFGVPGRLVGAFIGSPR